MRLSLYGVIVCCSLFCLGGYAASEVNPTKPAKKKGFIYCPQPNQLSRDPHHKTWFAEGGWRSYTLSFANSVDRFLGAQWQGATVGNVYCIYSSNSQMTFKITLAYYSLAFEPHGIHWGKNLGGYKDCLAAQPQDCPFMPRVHPKKMSIYQELDQLKTDVPQQPGF